MLLLLKHQKLEDELVFTVYSLSNSYCFIPSVMVCAYSIILLVYSYSSSSSSSYNQLSKIMVERIKFATNERNVHIQNY